MAKDLLQQGDVIELRGGHEVYADVPEHFIFTNRVGSWALTHSKICIGGHFAYLAGRYVVVLTTHDGGGTGHGPHDVYPSGHHVWCEKLVRDIDSPVRVDFYQTGCFSAMIEDITPVGTAKPGRWEMTEGAK
jgi:hypothetical protein